MGKKLLFAGLVAFGLFVFFGTPFGGENFEELTELGTLAIVVIGFVASFALMSIFGNGSNNIWGGSNNTIDNSTTNLTVVQPPPGDAVTKHMGGKKKGR